MLEVQHAAYAIEAELIGYPQLPPLHETLEGLQGTPEELWLCEEGGELCGVVGLEQHADELVIATGTRLGAQRWATSSWFTTPERWKLFGGGFQSWPRQDGQGYVL